jgi:hypothetical protein
LRAAALSRPWPVIHFEKAADSEARDDIDNDQTLTDELNHGDERSTRGSDGAA